MFKRLLELDPNDEDARVQMGRVYLADGQFDDAYDEFQPVVEKLAERREDERAASLLQQIVQKNPSHAKTLARLVEVYRAMKKDMLGPDLRQLTEAYIERGQRRGGLGARGAGPARAAQRAAQDQAPVRARQAGRAAPRRPHPT